MSHPLRFSATLKASTDGKPALVYNMKLTTEQYAEFKALAGWPADAESLRPLAAKFLHGLAELAGTSVDTILELYDLGFAFKTR